MMSIIEHSYHPSHLISSHLNWVWCNWSEPRWTGSCAAKRPVRCRGRDRPITAHLVQVKWGQMRWDGLHDITWTILHCKKYPHIHGYFVASFPHFNWTSVGPRFIIPSIYGHKRITRNRGSVKMWKTRHEISADIRIFFYSVKQSNERTPNCV